MRASRLVGLLGLLQARGRMTAGQLAAELEVSQRTILRDIEALSAAGIPVYAVRGSRAGSSCSTDSAAISRSPPHAPRSPGPAPARRPRGHGSGCRRAAAASRRCSAGRPASGSAAARRGRRA